MLIATHLFDKTYALDARLDPTIPAHNLDDRGLRRHHSMENCSSK